jgi:transposase
LQVYLPDSAKNKERYRVGQRAVTLTQILGFDGFKVSGYFETHDGVHIDSGVAPRLLRGTTLVLAVARRWLPRCPRCGRACRGVHERLPKRRWTDLCWAEHSVVIEYAPVRVKCRHCDATPVELIAWAEAHQRQTRRLQQHLAVQAASMPIMHVAALHGLDWSTVRRAEDAALERWQQTRPAVRLRMVGVDEKYLGRRAKNRPEKFITIVSNLETGEPLWLGPGRREETLAGWLSSLSPAQKADLVLFAMDMHEPFANAVRADKELAHVAIVHDPFHVMKRAGEAIDELRRSVLFRAGPELRAVGRGKRWLVLRAWVRLSDEQRIELQGLLRANATLAHAYQVKEQLRDVLRAPTWMDMIAGLGHVLRRTARRNNVPMRKLHDSLRRHFREIVALGEHHPPTGRIEALNNNWETLVRRGRGYRDLQSMLRRLRFMTVNPLRSGRGLERFLALGATPPFPVAIAA